MTSVKVIIGFALILGCVNDLSAEFYLKHLSYTRLPTTLPPKEKFQLFGGTAEEAAYDPIEEMLYVVG